MPPIVKVKMPPTQYRSGTVHSTVPRHSVAIQLKIFTPVGTAMMNSRA